MIRRSKGCKRNRIEKVFCTFSTLSFNSKALFTFYLPYHQPRQDNFEAYLMNTITMVESPIINGGALGVCRGLKWISDHVLVCVSSIDFSPESRQEEGCYLNYISFVAIDDSRYSMNVISNYFSSQTAIDGIKSIVLFDPSAQGSMSFVINDKSNSLKLPVDNSNIFKIVSAEDLCSISFGVFALLYGGPSRSWFSLHDYRDRAGSTGYGDRPYVCQIRHQFAKKIRHDVGTNRIFVQVILCFENFI